MAKLIRGGKLSARETLEAHLAQIERVNPKVNAIVTLASVADQARQSAFEADEAQAKGWPLGPLHGLPTAHKDLQPTKGIRTTFGSRIFKDFVPDQDSLLVERVRSAGAILVGKTNTPEFGARRIADIQRCFRRATLNPWDTTKTCGGSSGGAGGGTGLLHAPDRRWYRIWRRGHCAIQPASAASSGLRPSPGRIPREGPALGRCSLGVEGPMARSVADLAFYFSAIADTDPHFAQPLGRDFKDVRVAWWKDLGGVPIDARVREITNAQLRVFESMGCIVEEAEPDFTGGDETFRTLRFRSTALRMADHAKQHPDLIKDTLLWEIEQGNLLTELDVNDAEAKHTELARRMGRFLDHYEILRPAGKSGAAVRCDSALAGGNRRDEDGHLHRLDEVLLLHLRYGYAVDLRALRLYTRRFTCRYSDCGAEWW